MNNYLYTKFSITLHDLLIEEPTLLDFMVLDTEEHTNKFKEMFIAYWNIYEICAETTESFKIILANTFVVHRDKYIELINAYETRINMLDGVVITEINNENRIDNSNDLKTNYDLPRSTTATRDIPTYKTTLNNSNESTYTSSNTTKGGNQIELKNAYLKQIRNIYAEFVNEFSNCFLHIFY